MKRSNKKKFSKLKVEIDTLKKDTEVILSNVCLTSDEYSLAFDKIIEGKNKIRKAMAVLTEDSMSNDTFGSCKNMLENQKKNAYG